MKKIALFVSLLAYVASLVAQSSYTFTAHRNVVRDGYNFWISEPDTYVDRKEPFPLVIFLHGASLCGNDLERVRKYGCLDAISMGRDINAIVLAPQNPGGSWNAGKVLKLLEWTTRRYDIDTNRVYLIGMSLGGFGTIEFLATYGERIAASMELCGGTVRKDLCKLNDVPLWIIHGTADRAVPVDRAHDIVNSMKKCGSTSLLRFDMWQGVNHSQLAKLFYLDETYAWLFSHTKNASPKTVNQDIDIKAKDLDRAYQNINRNANKITVSRHAGNNNDMRRTDDWEEKDAEPVVEQKQEAAKKHHSASHHAYHTVKKGDTLYSIAKRHHTTVDKICRLNNIKETTTLQIGRKLKVK